MAFSTTHSGLSATPNITPLIDVLLVLLIIFMVITPSASQGLSSAVAPQTSRAMPSSTAPAAILEVRPPLQSSAAVQYSLNGRSVAAGDLPVVLAEARAAGASTLWIAGDPALAYGAVAAAATTGRQAGFAVSGLLPDAGR